MNLKQLIVGITLSSLTHYAAAFQQDDVSLKENRENVIKEYIHDLQKMDHEHITQLFEKNGIVVSTSRGMIDAKDFFYSFLPSLSSAHTELHQYFYGEIDPNHLTARFHFTFKFKNGEEGNGEYIDEFVFSAHSTKLAGVYMFENVTFQNIDSIE